MGLLRERVLALSLEHDDQLREAAQMPVGDFEMQQYLPTALVALSVRPRPQRVGVLP